MQVSEPKDRPVTAGLQRRCERVDQCVGARYPAEESLNDPERWDDDSAYWLAVSAFPISSDAAFSFLASIRNGSASTWIAAHTRYDRA